MRGWDSSFLLEFELLPFNQRKSSIQIGIWRVGDLNHHVVEINGRQLIEIEELSKRESAFAWMQDFRRVIPVAAVLELLPIDEGSRTLTRNAQANAWVGMAGNYRLQIMRIQNQPVEKHAVNFVPSFRYSPLVRAGICRLKVGVPDVPTAFAIPRYGLVKCIHLHVLFYPNARDQSRRASGVDLNPFVQCNATLTF